LKKENRGKGNKYLNILINEAQKDRRRRRRRRRYFYLPIMGPRGALFKT
jgi:hypothetical protein